MKKNTYDYIFNYFKENQCELLSKEYNGAYRKLDYICKCGKIYSQSFHYFKRAKQCRSCSVTNSWKTRNTINHRDVAKEFSDAGCKLLDICHIKTQKLKYICSCGNESSITYSDFRRGRRCKKCGDKRSIFKRTGSLSSRWITDRYKYNEYQKFRRRCKDMVRYNIRYLGFEKRAKSRDLLGYNATELMNHITSHPNYENIKHDFHIDHIFPIRAFVDYGIKDIKLINCLENLQPLSSTENLRKNDSYDCNLFKEWLLTKGIII